MKNYDKWKTMSVEDAAIALTAAEYCDKSCAGKDKFCFDCAVNWLNKEIKK